MRNRYDETPEPRPSRRDAALAAGFDPHPDDAQPPAAWITRDFEESGYDDVFAWFAAGVEEARAKARADYERTLHE